MAKRNGTKRLGTATSNQDQRRPALQRERDVCEYLGISRTTLWDYRRNKGFPPPILLGGSRLRWRLDAVDSWIAAQPHVVNTDALQRAKRAADASISVRRERAELSETARTNLDPVQS